MIEICGIVPGQQLVPAAELGVPGQRGRRVLDAGAAGVVDADDRAADHRHPLHEAGDLAAEHLPTVPWNTVWSWLNTPTGRPLMVPWPVTTPSPKSALGSPGCLASAPISRKLPGRPARGCGRGRWGCPSCRVWPRPFHRRVPGQFQPFAQFGKLLGGGDGRVRGGFGGHGPPSLSIRLIASLMCAPTFAMYGSSIAWMCSPPMGRSPDRRRTRPSRRPVGGSRSAART